ncbi:hypothetical protein [Calidifontibacillus oryziterrae]|uniref:hypothetical protein n=1 Tax=Calidifontibacillus oryziterrae TaxID=1191699 RepID=UPI0002F8D1A2|nr:hypothetical protein [Calidifontibacillus oryziterrae]
MVKRNLSFGVCLLILLSLPSIKELMESSMVGQMIVQLPLLILSGFLIGKAVKTKIPVDQKGFNNGGISGMLLAIFTILFWLLPRSIDASINDEMFSIAKFTTLPLLAGFPIALSWERLHINGRNFIWANLISMLVVMGWLYLNSPVRLCNNYLLDQQVSLGKTFLFLTGVLIISGIFRSFMVDHRTN